MTVNWGINNILWIWYCKVYAFSTGFTPAIHNKGINAGSFLAHINTCVNYGQVHKNTRL
jgi:hypothetical protein